MIQDFTQYEPGFDIPARPGMTLEEIYTPCLVVDRDSLERNLRQMARLAREGGVALRVHGKMHRSVDLALLQMEIGGAIGLCCQKVAEAETFARGGIRDILITNEVNDPRQLARLAQLAAMGCKIGICVDDLRAIGPLSAAAQAAGAEIRVLIELDCGQRRCGLRDVPSAVAVAQAVVAAEGLHFGGIQAYHGAAQHFTKASARAEAIAGAVGFVSALKSALADQGIAVETVTGAGTGTFPLEIASGVYTELQCGSYAVMDAAYGAIEENNGARFDAGLWQNALFILASVISQTAKGHAVMDAGLKSMSGESGLPLVYAAPQIHATGLSDEHCTLHDENDSLRLGDRLKLVPGHCDPTFNLHDWIVVLDADQRVETLWPVSARGRSY